MPLRPKNLKDKFDSRTYGTAHQKPILTTNPKPQEVRSHVPNLNLFQGLDMLHILLKDYQGRFIQGENEELVYFPNAWIPPAKGDKIKNLDTGEVYFVDEVITTSDKYPDNYVRLKGKNFPRRHEILRLDDNANRAVNLIPARPDSPSKPYSQGQDGFEQYDEDREIEPWSDVITYTTWEEPGSLEGKMFQQGTKDIKPRPLEEIETIEGPVEIYKQAIDSKVRFDFWTESNEDSQRMRMWFRDFYNSYNWLMVKNGLERVLWVGDFTETSASRWRAGIVHRSSEFWIRTNYSFSKNLTKIRIANFQVSVPRGNDDPSQSRDTTLLSIN